MVPFAEMATPGAGAQTFPLHGNAHLVYNSLEVSTVTAKKGVRFRLGFPNNEFIKVNKLRFSFVSTNRAAQQRASGMGFDVRDLDLNPDTATYRRGELGQIT